VDRVAPVRTRSRTRLRRCGGAADGFDPGPNPSPSDIERGPSIFTALQEQLGLKLESIRGPREFLIIDHAQRPEAN